MPKSVVYYINENEDVFSFFDKKGIELTASIRQRTNFISRNNYNNYIGYYQFLHQDTYYKFFVIPKIYKNEANKEACFTGFLAKYYKLTNKYQDEITPRNIKGNIIDFSFDNFNENNSKTVQDFIQYKYQYALNILDVFFRKHTKVRYLRNAYTSQSIRHKIDLARNIRSLDNSMVHQIKKEPYSYSIIAYIATYALKQFKREKLEHLISGKEKLQQKTHSILNKINKRYTIDSQFRFKDRDIITNKIAKLFKKNLELKKVYQALLILIGLEHFQNKEQSQEVKKIENMVALFFNPSNLYEWIVYDKLKDRYGANASILQATKNSTNISYELRSTTTQYIKNSKPDFIVIEDNKVSIIDAKWKILKTPSEIDFNDIAKLKRDVNIRKIYFPNKLLQGILVYPIVKFDFKLENPFRNSYDRNFDFFIEQVL